MDVSMTRHRVAARLQLHLEAASTTIARAWIITHELMNLDETLCI